MSKLTRADERHAGRNWTSIVLAGIGREAPAGLFNVFYCRKCCRQSRIVGRLVRCWKEPCDNQRNRDPPAPFWPSGLHATASDLPWEAKLYQSHGIGLWMRAQTHGGVSQLDTRYISSHRGLASFCFVLLRSASFCFVPAAQATPLRSRKLEMCPLQKS